MLHTAVRRVVAAAALVALLATAPGCSGDAGEPSSDPAPAPTPATATPPATGTPGTAALRDGFVALWVGDDREAEDVATGECFADALLAGSTPAALADAGLLDAAGSPSLTGLTEEGAALWVDAQFACSDLVAESGRAQVAATKGKVDRAAYETCLRDALTEEQLREVAERSLLGDLGGEAVAAFSTAQLDCVQAALPPD